MSPTKFRLLIAASGWLISTFLCSGVAKAQDPQPNAGVGNAKNTKSSNDTSLTIGNIIITGTRQPAVSKVLTSVDILGGSIAQRLNVNNAFQIFQRLPGVLTTNFGQGTTNGSISMRGFNGEGGINAVKLTIDGVPSNDSQGFTPYLDAIFPLDIDRVEVIRGTSDPRYGLHNIAGNASIFTRQGGDYVDAQAIAGSFSTYDGEVAVGKELGSLSQNYFVGYRHSDGERQHAKSDRWTVGGKWYLNLSPSFKTGLIARYYEAKAQEPGYLLLQDAENDPNTSYQLSSSDGDRRKLAQVSFHIDGDLAKDLESHGIVYFNHFKDQRFVRFAASIPQFERETQESQYGGIANLVYRPENGAGIGLSMFEVGANVESQDNAFQQYTTVTRVRTGQTVGRRFTLDNYGGYVQAIFNPADWLKIVPAYRIDDFTGHLTNELINQTYPLIDYGVIGQPKLSVSVTPSKGLIFYANYGRTFQIGLASSGYLIPPQTNIQPSKNDGLEAGVKFKSGSWFEGRIALWQQIASGEIQYDELTLQNQNLGRTRRRGYDIQANLNPTHQLTIWGSFSQQKGVIEVAAPGQVVGNVIDHVPNYLYSGGIEYRPTDRIRLSALFNGQSNYEIDTSNTHGRYGHYNLLNLEAGYKLTPKIELSAQVQNVTDDRYIYAWWDGSEVLTSPADGRGYFLTLRAKY